MDYIFREVCANGLAGACSSFVKKRVGVTYSFFIHALHYVQLKNKKPLC